MVKQRFSIYCDYCGKEYKGSAPNSELVAQRNEMLSCGWHSISVTNDGNFKDICTGCFLGCKIHEVTMFLTSFQKEEMKTWVQFLIDVTNCVYFEYPSTLISKMNRARTVLRKVIDAINNCKTEKVGIIDTEIDREEELKGDN